MSEHAVIGNAGYGEPRKRSGGIWVLAAGATVVAGGALMISAAIGAGVVLARAAATPQRSYDLPVEVVRIERISGATVLWLRGPDVGLPGKYGLWWESGSVRLGEVLERSGVLVARAVMTVDCGELTVGLRGRISGWWYPSIEAFAEESADVRGVEEIELPLSGGTAPAWVLRPAKRGRPGRAGRWAIHVHGRGAKPEETLRGIAPVARAGVTSLVVSYRNDAGAPAGDGGRYGFGITEAQDVDAAIAYAVTQGATRVTLVGWSMGGTACLIAATSGAYRRVIDGIVLDSPAIDWTRLLAHQAKLRRAPAPVAKLGVALLERGIVAADTPGNGVDFAALTPARFAEQIQVPTLIQASTGDTFVPSEAAERLAQLCPQFVQLRLVDEAEHVKLWNVDESGWERTLEVFMKALPRPAWRG